MIKSFTFCNFKSYNQMTTLSFELPDRGGNTKHKIGAGGSDLYPVLMVIGEHGSGKSGLIDAIRYLSNTLKDSYRFDYYSRQERTPNLGLDRNEVSSFETVFSLDDNYAYASKNRSCRYSFCEDHSGVRVEYLSIEKDGEETRLLERKRSKECFFEDRDEAGELSVWSARGPRILGLAEGELNGMKYFGDISRTLQEIYAPNLHGHYKNLEDTGVQWLLIWEEKKMWQEAVEYMKCCGFDIISFNHTPMEFMDGNRGFGEITAKHKAGSAGEMITVPLDQEADSVCRALTAYAAAFIALSSGRLLLLDDAEEALGIAGVRWLIERFEDTKRNPYHAQLLFTSTAGLEPYKDLLGPDEVVRVNKTENGASWLQYWKG